MKSGLPMLPLISLAWVQIGSGSGGAGASGSGVPAGTGVSSVPLVATGPEVAKPLSAGPPLVIGSWPCVAEDAAGVAPEGDDPVGLGVTSAVGEQALMSSITATNTTATRRDAILRPLLLAV